MLARHVVSALGEDVAARIPTDYFFVPRSPGVSLDAFLARPLAWDWALIRERLALPIGTPTTTPDADFEAFVRRGDEGGLPFTIRPVMVIDAMAPYPDADLVVRLDAPGDVRRERIVMRDRRWRTRVADRWPHLEASWRGHAGASPNAVLDGMRPMAENAARVCQLVEEGRRGRRDG